MKYTIKDFRKDYPTEEACLQKVFETNCTFKCCPKCKSSEKFRRISNRKSYYCPKCYYQVYPCKGTIFQKSTTPLLHWFYVMFLFTTSKNGLSACEVERQIGVKYDTALRMLHKIRMNLVQSNEILTGITQIDETFVGGKNKNRHKDKKVANSQGRSFKDKTPVMGMLNNGIVRAFAVNDTTRESIQPIIYNHVSIGSTLHTDEWKAYKGLNHLYNHGFVDHGRKQYMNENITTNGIENFWSIFKRTLNGSYIHVTKKYLQLYVNEVVFRFNNRNNPEIFNILLISCSS